MSWRELVRRAGFEDSDFGRVSYHLLPRARTRNGHHVPSWLIDALEPVLPISRSDLVRAAAEAAGYDVREVSEPHSPDDVVTMVTRLLGDEKVDQAERDRVAAEVLAAVSRTLQRDRQTPPAGDTED